MAAFFATQLDFIFFFYGLAFILLGSTCFAIANGRDRRQYWLVLGMFALCHGAGEWLDMVALVIGDTPAFAVSRTALMTGSFLLLMDAARQGAIEVGARLPGRLLYIPLVIAVTAVGFAYGLDAANALARYSIGLVGAVGMSWVFARQAWGFSGPAKWTVAMVAIGFALYGIAAGAIVPTAPLWPASFFNYGWFLHVTGGIPIQLIRGLLACWLALSLWTVWGRGLVLDLSSERYTIYMRMQFIWMLTAMATILIFGWTLTEVLGEIHEQDIEKEAGGELDLLASRLSGETDIIDGIVKALGGSHSLPILLAGGIRRDDEGAQSVLDMDVEISGARLGFILDMSGSEIAASGAAAAAAKTDFYALASVRRAIAGEAGSEFSLSPATGSTDYYATSPIRAGDGTVVGVAVLTKSLDRFAADLDRFDHPYFFVQPDGIVALTNQTEMLRRTLWPLSADQKSRLIQELGPLDDHPMVGKEIIDATWIKVDGARNYVRRRYANDSRWSLVLVMRTPGLLANRLLGILITLLLAAVNLTYLLGRERGLRDQVRMEQRLKLQELAQDLRVRAATDPLTGLYNRSKFDELMAQEISRAIRYATPLSVILYDVDYFKSINDRFGHVIGDKVLIALSQRVSSALRTTDLLVRWGGEEFVILAAGSDGEMAYLAAEKLRAAIADLTFAEVGAVSCSFGIASYVDGDTTETLVARADAALYRAKIKGRNRVEVAA